jgi:two-component system cell cycle sensor histidine kinase/response regulator CckA
LRKSEVDMKSWRIGQRLGIGFGVGVVFLIAVGWLSLRGMAAMNANLQTIANERSVVVGFTNQVLQISVDNARITIQLFMVSGPAEEQLLALNKENQRLIGVGVERIEKLLSTEKEKALFNEVKTLRTPYLDSRAEMKKLLAAGHRDAAIAMANDDMIPKLMVYRASWNRFLAAQNDALRAAVAEGAARYRATRAMALSLIILAALAATVIGVAVTRRITGPILDLTRTVERVSWERDYSLRAACSTKDELGLLAGGFNDMLRKIQTQNVALQEARDGFEDKVKERTLDLESANAMFRATFEQAAVGIAHVGTDGRWLRVNRRLCEMVGYTREELLARTFQEITHPADLEADLENVRRMLAGEIQAYSMEKRYIRKDGTADWIALTVSLARDHEGRPKYFISVIEDIEPRRRAEEQEARLRSQLEQAQKMESVGRLAGGIAHDFNNLLTVIQGYGEMLSTSLAGDEAQREQVQEILQAAGRATNLTRQLLAFSRRQVLETQVLDLGTVVADTEKMLRRLIGEDVEVVVVKPATLGRVKADPGQLEQVLLNLAVNSRDAMPGGGRLTLELADLTLDAPFATSHDSIPPGRYVVVAVRDTGSGMDAETLGHLFEPFFTTKEKGKGTGLGLATVFGIVKQSGGYVDVASAPGAGTTIRVYLPRTDAPRKISGIRPPVFSLSGSETVLLVEDEAAVRNLVRAVLERKGYVVLVAPDGAAALDLVDKHTGVIHVLLTDIVMPRMSGRDLAPAVRARRPSIKVIFMSGYTADVPTELGTEGGPVFLSKPFNEYALTSKLREVLDTPGPERSPTRG